MIVVAKETLKWNSDVDEDEIRDVLLELSFGWCYGKDGPFLEMEIECFDLTGDGMAEDLNALQRLNVIGSIIFVDTCAGDRPFIEATLSEGGVSWYTASDITNRVISRQPCYITHVSPLKLTQRRKEGGSRYA